MRRQTLLFNQKSISKLENLKELYMKLLSDREYADADLQRDSEEEDWEDESEEPLEEDKEIKREYLVM